MSFILNCTPSVQGAVELPRMCTLPVGDVGDHRHLVVQIHTAVARKFQWWQCFHGLVAEYHDSHCEAYT